MGAYFTASGASGSAWRYAGEALLELAGSRAAGVAAAAAWRRHITLNRAGTTDRGEGGQLFFQLGAVATRTLGRRSGLANQRFEFISAGTARVFKYRHGIDAPSKRLEPRV